MLAYVGLVIGAVLGLFALAVGADGAETPGNLVRNPAFTLGQGESIRHWTVWKPPWERAACAICQTDRGLLVSSPKEPYGVGGVWQQIDGIEGGKAYAVEAVCDLTAIATPRRSVMVRLEWFKGKKQMHPAGWLVRGPVLQEGAAAFGDVFVAPEEADAARLTLEVKWPGAGSVLWKRAGLWPTEPPKPRKVKLGTVYLRPKNSTPEKNLDLWCAQIDAAGTLGLDISMPPAHSASTSSACARPSRPSAQPRHSKTLPGRSPARTPNASAKRHAETRSGSSRASPSATAAESTTPPSSSTARGASRERTARSICRAKSGRRASRPAANTPSSRPISAAWPS
ncbi:MAG: hypothetical protein AMK72_04250 [Planctomycetes bacterium SM23_25]|nr:MAG: hypothetical protein AMK72_04250 [Planctomycetes bacterium SM23_25]